MLIAIETGFFKILEILKSTFHFRGAALYMMALKHSHLESKFSRSLYYLVWQFYPEGCAPAVKEPQARKTNIE